MPHEFGTTTNWTFRNSPPLFLPSPPESEYHSDEEQAARWVADMDVKGVQRVNFVMGGGNDNLAKIVSYHPERFTGMAHHDVFGEGAAEELERAVVELGLRGFKMIASSQTRPVDDRALYPVWEVAERLEVPVLIHFGVLGGGGGPARDLKNMEWEYFILEWAVPWESEEREYAFCRRGELLEEFAGMDRRQLEEVFDALGSRRWELVHAYEWRKFFFKRQVASS